VHAITNEADVEMHAFLRLQSCYSKQFIVLSLANGRTRIMLTNPTAILGVLGIISSMGIKIWFSLCRGKRLAAEDVVAAPAVLPSRRYEKAGRARLYTRRRAEKAGACRRTRCAP
jgi:hypothetical protein